MNHKRLIQGVLFCVPLLLAYQTANAWFFFWWPGMFSGTPTDPDSIVVSSRDRLVGKCGGYHSNQTRSSSPETQAFSQGMMDKIIQNAEDKDKVTELAKAYDQRWSQAAKVDMQTNRRYGGDLGTACRTLGMPINQADQDAMKRQEEARQQAEAQRLEEARIQAEAKRQEETQLQEEARPLAVGGASADDAQNRSAAYKKLRELDALRKDGILTQQEFDTKKADILKGM